MDLKKYLEKQRVNMKYYKKYKNQGELPAKYLVLYEQFLTIETEIQRSLQAKKQASLLSVARKIYLDKSVRITLKDIKQILGLCPFIYQVIIDQNPVDI